MDKTEALTKLRDLCPKGTVVTCVLRSVARSGLTRRIDFFVLTPAESAERGRVHKHFLSGYMAAIGIGTRKCGEEGLRIDGAGEDKGASTVHLLGRLLHGDGYALECEWL